MKRDELRCSVIEIYTAFIGVWLGKLSSYAVNIF